MSSPGTYPRCSAKSIDAPKYGARCRPLMNPSTTVRASSSRLPMRARILGSTNRAPGMACESILLAAGPHPRRELTLMRRRLLLLAGGVAWPQALHYSLALGPHPQRELTL